VNGDQGKVHGNTRSRAYLRLLEYGKDLFEKSSCASAKSCSRATLAMRPGGANPLDPRPGRECEGGFENVLAAV